MKMLKKVKVKIINSYNSLSYWATDEKLNTDEKNYTILLNKYALLLFLVFFLHSIFIILFIGITADCVFLAAVSLVWILENQLKEKRKNKFLISFKFIILCLIITYYSSYCGYESGVFLFYFPLLTANHILFSIKHDKRFIIFVTLFAVLCLYISAVYDFGLVEKSSFCVNKYTKKLFIINLTFNILLLFSLVYFSIEDKKNAINEYLENNNKKRREINVLKSKVSSLANIVDGEKFSPRNIEELLSLASVNEALFLEKFECYFPYFFENLEKNKKDKLTYSDLYLSALIRLGLSTKQIATSTKSTVKSVESKKYRLRKKLDIQANQELTLWISTI